MSLILHHGKRQGIQAPSHPYHLIRCLCLSAR